MRERPILMSAPNVRSILAGTKSQTRRAMKPQPITFVSAAGMRMLSRDGAVQSWNDEAYAEEFSPHGVPGDRLYVKEAWRASSAHNGLAPRDIPIGDSIEYCADPERIVTGRYRHARFMMRWMSRIVLEIADVRVERLQDISESDAKAEGVERHAPGCAADVAYRAPYRRLWESINGPGSWDANPWVWALTFRRIGDA